MNEIILVAGFALAVHGTFKFIEDHDYWWVLDILLLILLCGAIWLMDAR